MNAPDFPPGSKVVVTQRTIRRDVITEAKTIGTVESWEDLKTASWFSHSLKGQLWLKRLKIRKDDGEISLLNVDQETAIELLDA